MKKSIWFMWKKGYRTLTKNKGKTTPILILMIFSIGFGTLMYDQSNLLDRVIEETLEITNFTDGFVNLDPIPLSIGNSVFQNLSKNYIKEYVARMILKIKFEINNETFDGLLVGLNTSLNSHINALVDNEKNELDDIEFSLDWNFANEHDIKVDQNMSLSLGSIKENVKVNDIGFSPEFLYVPLYENIIIPSFTYFPVFYVNISYINTHFINSTSPLINQIIYKLKENVSQQDVEDVIEENLGECLKNIVSQYDHPFIAMLRKNVESVGPLLIIMILIFIIGSIITLSVVIYRLIDNDLKSVSVFQAIGANKSEIIGGYLIFNLIIFFISLIIGIILSFFGGIPFGSLMAERMGIPFYPLLHIEFFYALFLGFVILSVSLISSYLIVKKSFRMDVLKTLKYETKFLKKTNIIEKIFLRFKKNLHPFTRYNLRRIFGKKIYFFSLIIVLCISSCFLIFSYGYPDSISYSLDKKINEIEKWDAVANTWQYENESTLFNHINSLSEVDEFEFGIIDNVLFSSKISDDFNETIKLMSFKNNSKLHLLKAENDAIIEKNEQILVSKDIIYEFNVNVGDKIYLKDKFSNISYEFTIIGSINDFTFKTIYLSLEMAQNIIEEKNKVNTIYFTAKNNISKATEQVQDMIEINNVFEKSDLQEIFNNFNNQFLTFTIIWSIVFTLFGLMITAMVIKLIIEYRIEDYGNMKAIGIFDSEIRKSLILEVLVYFLLSTPLGIFLGLILSDFVVDSYSSLSPGISFNIYPISYFYFSLHIITIIILVLFLQFRKLKKMNLAEITKLKTFG